jgi:hypothetical protein
MADIFSWLQNTMEPMTKGNDTLFDEFFPIGTFHETIGGIAQPDHYNTVIHKI